MTTNEPEITIRQISTVDVEALRELRLEALRAHPVAFSADYNTELNRTPQAWKARIQDSPIFFAQAGNTMIGMAGFYRSRSSKTGHHGTIWGVYIRPDYRGHGLGDKLINQCIQWARENEVRMVYIAAAAVNTAAIRCYARCGFTVYGLQPMAIFHDNIYYDELLMAQAL